MDPTTNPEPTTEMDVRELVRAALRFKWLILSITLVVGAAVTLWTMRQPKVYEATGTIEFDPRPTQPLGDSLQDVSDPVSSYWSLREYYATQLRVLESRNIAERVVTDLGLQHDPDFLGKSESGFEPASLRDAAQLLMSRVSVEQVEDTRLVEVSVTDHDPERAALVANAIIDAYIQKSLEDRMASSVAALEWLGEQLSDLRTELNDSEMALHEFKEEHNVLSVSMEDRQNLVAGEIQAFNDALTEARQRRIRLSARVERLRQSIQADPLEVTVPEESEGAATHQLQDQLREKLAERASLASRYGMEHPRMKSLSGEITALREQLNSALQGIAEGALADLREARQVEGDLRAAVDQAHEAGLQLNLREIEYQRLNRSRENKAKLYELVLSRNTETELLSMGHRNAVRVVDSALAPRAAIKPNVPMSAAVGLLIGLALGIGLAFMIYYLDRRLKGPKDVEELGVSILGIVPSIDMGKASADGRDSRDLIAHREPMSQAAECCRTIRTNLTFMSPDDPIRSFVVTSPTPREGKTTVASNLAISIANTGQSVLFIDTDLRRPRVHKAFDLDNELGVTSVALGAVDLDGAVQETVVSGLHVLTSGPIPPNPSELLHGRGFARIVAEALEKYDRVILDSPPLGAVTDAAILSTLVRGVVLVVKTDQTTRDGLKNAIRQLQHVSANILGAVVNDVDAANNPYGYYQYYRYRYASDEADQHLDAAE
jgi:succinoglycan biosynthesis transport protein ExoP